MAGPSLRSKAIAIKRRPLLPQVEIHLSVVGAPGFQEV